MHIKSSRDEKNNSQYEFELTFCLISEILIIRVTWPLNNNVLISNNNHPSAIVPSLISLMFKRLINLHLYLQL